MPTTNPRMIITISHKTKAVLDKLAEASEKPASRWVTEMLEESVEAVFLPLIEALQVAKNQKADAYQILNHALAKTQHNAAQLSLSIHEDIKAEKKKTRGKNVAKK